VIYSCKQRTSQVQPGADLSTYSDGLAGNIHEPGFMGQDVQVNIFLHNYPKPTGG